MNFFNNIHLFATYACLILGVTITLRSVYGYFMEVKYHNIDKNLSNVFIVLLYTQLVMEASYFLNVTFRYEDSLRAIEHVALTLFASIMTQGGRLITLKSSDNSVKFRFRSIYYGIATGLLIYAFILNLT